MGTIANAKVTHYYNCYNGDFIGCLRSIRNHPIKYTIPNITEAAIPIVGYAAFAIYSHSFADSAEAVPS